MGRIMFWMLNGIAELTSTASRAQDLFHVAQLLADPDQNGTLALVKPLAFSLNMERLHRT
jgi:hypothetical protein